MTADTEILTILVELPASSIENDMVLRPSFGKRTAQVEWSNDGQSVSIINVDRGAEAEKFLSRLKDLGVNYAPSTDNPSLRVTRGEISGGRPQHFDMAAE